MNPFVISLILLAGASLAAEAQAPAPPRVRTSAPKEKTAVPAQNVQKAGDKKSGSRDDKAPQGKNTDGSAAKANTKAQNAKVKSGKKAAARQTNIQTSSSDLYMAVKTNLVYDAFALMNASFEMQFAPRFTAELPVTWSLWDWKEDLGLRTVLLQPGVKYHFTQPGSGHALGVDIAVGWYNFRHDRHRYQDCSRPLLGVSLNYSYTLPLGRGWAAEFALGVGYVNSMYNTYYNVDNGAWINKRERNYFGPTRIGISLVYNI